MAFSTAFLLTVITLVSAGLFAAKVWWMPENVSVHGEGIDRQLVLTMICCGVIFLLAQLSLAFLIWKRRGTAVQKVDYTHGNNTLEWTWTTAAAVLFIVLAWMGKDVWAGIMYTEAPENALQVEVTAQQFAWNFRFAGADGKFGPRHLKLVDDAAANPLGLDFDNDTESQDDIVVPSLVIPVNRPVELIMRSKDVLHGFWVREFRLKQDLVPGLVIRRHFTTTKIGKYELMCAELCGMQHHEMRSFVEVVSAEDFEKWLEARAAELY